LALDLEDSDTKEHEKREAGGKIIYLTPSPSLSSVFNVITPAFKDEPLLTWT